MKKKLNTEAIKNELEESVYFPTKKKEPYQEEQVASAPLSSQTTDIKQIVVPRYHA